MSNANTQQVGGGHYKGTTYQHWDFVMIALAGRYLEGNITKYVTRWRKKNGLEDLKKARHYLTKLIEQFNLGNVHPLYTVWRSPLQSPEHFCDVNGVDVSERMVVQLVSNWHGINDLHKAGNILDALIEQVEHAVTQYAEEDQRPIGECGSCQQLIYPDKLTGTTCGCVGSQLVDDAQQAAEEAGAGYVNQG